MQASKKEEKVALDKKKLELKKEEQMNKIKKRMECIKKITSELPQVEEMYIFHGKFGELYEKRKVFSEELLKSRQNCGELKSKIQKFVKQQNMLMIKLKSTMGRGKSD